MKLFLLIISTLPFIAVAQDQISSTTVETVSPHERKNNIKLKVAYGTGFQYERSIHEKITLGAEFLASSIQVNNTNAADLNIIAASADYYFSGTFQDGLVAGLVLGAAQVGEIKNQKRLFIDGEEFTADDRFLIVSSSLSYQFFSSFGLNGGLGLGLSSSKLNSSDVHLYGALGYSF